MENLLFAVKNVLPVFIVILLGIVLKQKKFLKDDFSVISNKIVFNVGLPAMIFNAIYNIDLSKDINPDILIFTIVGTIAYFLILCMVSLVFNIRGPAMGAFVQGAMRSNFVIIGFPLILNLFGERGMSKAAVVLAVAMPLYNIFAVFILTSTSKGMQKFNLIKVLAGVIKNPYIISVVAAFAFSFINKIFPDILFLKVLVFDVPLKTIGYLAMLTIPIALLDIGASFNFQKAFKGIKIAVFASFLKIIAAPVIFTYIAYVMGFRGDDLGVLYILFASPTAVSSYIMAKAMKSDADLASSIVVLTTLGSIATVFLGVLILKYINVIA